MTPHDDDTHDPRTDARVDRALDQVMNELRETYNVPPANPPLEAMWAEIDRSLDAAKVVPLRAVAGSRPRRSIERTGWGLGIAAALLAGIGIGRTSAGTGIDTVRGSATRVAQVAPGAQAPDAASTQRATDPVRPKPPVSERFGGESMTDPRPGTGGGVERVATATRRSAGAGESFVDARAEEVADEESSPRRYLGQATALLIALAGDAPRSGDDSRLVRRAGELLTTTRLLLDAPTVDDKTRALLEDLELVLTQVVRIQTESGREDLRLIREALEQRDLLPRLHTAVVAGSDD